MAGFRRSRSLGSADVVTPSGIVLPFAGSTSPVGWLLCFGQEVSRSDYASLFSILGTTYGSGNGTTTFNLPDLRGRTIAGVDNMGGVAANRLTSGGAGINATSPGAAGGAETVTLTSGQSGAPAHSHPNTLGGTTSFATTGHTHQHVSPTGLNSGNIALISYSDAALDAVGNYTFSDVVNPVTASFVGAGSSVALERAYVTSSGPSATGTVSISNQPNTTANAASAHTNTQPTIVLNYIIKV